MTTWWLQLYSLFLSDQIHGQQAQVTVMGGSQRGHEENIEVMMRSFNMQLAGGKKNWLLFRCFQRLEGCSEDKARRRQCPEGDSEYITGCWVWNCHRKHLDKTSKTWKVIGMDVLWHYSLRSPIGVSCDTRYASLHGELWCNAV